MIRCVGSIKQCWH